LKVERRIEDVSARNDSSKDRKGAPWQNQEGAAPGVSELERYVAAERGSFFERRQP
jgi:hypothetical protein